MNFHFAYPNVLPRKGLFIGCGRYTAFTTGKTVAAEYHEVQGAPVTPNKSNLKRAVQLLAAESYDSVKSLYHKQDRPEEKYQGDSLDLAWFLTHILRARKLCSKIQTDAWCTGVIQVDGSGPHLLDVDPDGFVLKLRAFLDTDNGDLLFIVPLANLDPQTRAMCEENRVQIIRLGSHASCQLSDLKRKTVLAIPADGLTNLLDFLFLTPDSGKVKGGKTRLYLLLLLLAGIAAFAGKPYIISGLQEQGLLTASEPATKNSVETTPVDPTLVIIPKEADVPQVRVEKIISSIEQGDFSSIPAFLKVDFSSEDKELQNLRRKISFPLSVQGEMEYQQEDGTRNSVAFDPHETPPTLTHHDYYRLRVQVDNPPDTLYLYLFQVDSSGGLTPIFPSSQFGTTNPLRPWQWPVIIPEKDDQWIFLDQLSDSAQKQTREFLYLLVTPWPAKDIDTLRNRLQDKPDNEDYKAQLLTRLSLWQQSGLPSITGIRWYFFHGR